MNEQPLDLKAFFRVVWRRRILIGVLALIGFVAGVAHVTLMPPMPKARVLVILPPSSLTTSNGTQVNQMPTQIIIATSTPVLAAAGAAVSPPVSPTALKSRVVATALAANVLQFQVTAPKASDAEKLANAEATDYIAYVNKTGSASTSGVVPALQQEATRLSNQIQGLQGQLNTATARLAADGTNTPAGQRDETLISSLRTEQEQVSLQLNNINNQIVTTQLSGSLSAGATQSCNQRPSCPCPRPIWPSTPWSAPSQRYLPDACSSSFHLGTTAGCVSETSSPAPLVCPCSLRSTAPVASPPGTGDDCSNGTGRHRSIRGTSVAYFMGCLSLKATRGSSTTKKGLSSTSSLSPATVPRSPPASIWPGRLLSLACRPL